MAQALTTVESTKVKSDDLLFDYTNPRLTDESGGLPTNEKDMIETLSKAADIDELLRSIAQNGYLPFDDMVVLKEDSGKYKVLEGNRRLAAVRLFRDPKLAEELEITLPNIGKEQLESLEELPVKLVGTEDAARAYIGFKHINGPHKWDALSKAKYSMRWIEQGGSLREIARTFGDTHNTVARQLNGLRVLEQAKKNGFKIDDTFRTRFAFSHLYTGVSQSGAQQYLGLSNRPSESDWGPDPISAENVPNLQRYMRWLYGSRAERLQPLIGRQNPDLGKLNRILSDSVATNVLESTTDLEQAYEEVEPRSKRFVNALVQARVNCDEALKLASDFDGQDATIIQTTQTLINSATAIHTLVQNKIEEKKVAKKVKR
jgi:ParB-like nuclease family protein